MVKNKIKIYLLQIILIIILFFALFASNMVTRGVLSIFMSCYALLVYYFLKRRDIKSIRKKQVMLLMFIFALVYLGVFYALGLYFGFEKTKVALGLWSLWHYIIPLGLILVSTEIIRSVFLQQDAKITYRSKSYDLSLVLTYIATVLVDLVIYTGIYDLTNLNDFLTALGFVLFAALSTNLLFNYVSSRYGSKPIILYRLMTVLYVYIIPIQPNVFLFLRSFLRMLYPYIMFLIFEKLFTVDEFVVAYAEKKKNFIWNAVLIVAITLLIMLISCQFKYGILVVGSRSMTGTIDVGDAIVYESYDDQEIKIGQVLVFNYDGIKTIHRVIDISNVNGVYRYYTKGDANSKSDDGFIIDEDIEGLVKFKIKYIGYPTLWVRELFVKD